MLQLSFIRNSQCVVSSHFSALTVSLSVSICRHDSGGSIFLRRPDYSAFNVLPRHKINSYHIKVRLIGCTSVQNG